MLLRAKSEQLPYKECGTILIPYNGELGSDISLALEKVNEKITDKDARNLLPVKSVLLCIRNPRL